jgi:uncharacterized membrane protein YfcA
VPDLSWLAYSLLVLAALGAGFIDAIAGGGGLLTLPSLLAVGLPPDLALGTNKGQSVFGSGGALAGYLHAGKIDRKRAWRMFPAGFLGSLAGASLVLVVPPATLRPLIVVLLVVAAVLISLPRPAAVEDAPADLPAHRMPLALGIALAIGMYDGFFGPGTGAFLLVLFAWALGDSLVHATANAKVVNFASNLAAVCVFASQDRILWSIAVPMAAAQLVGGVIGSRVAIAGGKELVRRVALCVVAALVVKITWDMLGAG